MYDLKCKREGCIYNKNCVCAAREISVDKAAECKSYTPSEDYYKKEKSKIKQRAVRYTTKVDCMVTGCIFNNNCMCQANGITVATLKNTNCPECCTVKVK